MMQSNQISPTWAKNKDYMIGGVKHNYTKVQVHDPTDFEMIPNLNYLQNFFAIKYFTIPLTISLPIFDNAIWIYFLFNFFCDFGT